MSEISPAPCPWVIDRDTRQIVFGPGVSQAERYQRDSQQATRHISRLEDMQ